MFTIGPLTYASGFDFLLIGGGYGNPGSGDQALTNIERYIYSTAVMAGTTALGSARQVGACSGSATIAYWFSGTASGGTQPGPIGALATSEKYTFASASRVFGTAVSARVSHYGVGNSTRAIVGAGATASPAAQVLTTEKYTYTGDTVAAATTLSGIGNSQPCTAGLEAYGLWFCGYDFVFSTGETNNTTRYTYSGDTVAAATNLGGNIKMSAAASGNLTNAIVIAGWNWSLATVYNTGRKYTYASNTTAASGSLAVTRAHHHGSGNRTVGIYGGGDTNTPSAIIYTSQERYTYSSDTAASTTALAFYRYNPRSVSGTPGGF